ncbi:MAG: hypothetical protein A2015_09715 [Spirochaetes bacterium GWF1_31_7]|nr:MAG: hypothetical protein A2015_09715 [Spirochaetes bacterium GWF1_31_7]OHD52053.1 MAG: hypothetical protein A2Y29_17475 [Spirochaetes bacterium GWE2_31_10]HBD93473.1 hypothetical protein [Spirochaetia bacterium]HBI36220.1 hypothetical protein [Spirochaetia bacterium]
MENKLTEEEILYLTRFHSVMKEKAVEDIIKSLLLWGKGWSWLKIRVTLLVSHHYISEIISKYKIGRIERIIEDNSQLKKIILFLYNANINHRKIFLPTYSPNFNLIERMWKLLKKEILSNYYVNYSNLRNNLNISKY